MYAVPPWPDMHSYPNPDPIKEDGVVRHFEPHTVQDKILFRSPDFEHPKPTSFIKHERRVTLYNIEVENHTTWCDGWTSEDEDDSVFEQSDFKVRSVFPKDSSYISGTNMQIDMKVGLLLPTIFPGWPQFGYAHKNNKIHQVLTIVFNHPGFRDMFRKPKPLPLFDIIRMARLKVGNTIMTDLTGHAMRFIYETGCFKNKKSLQNMQRGMFMDWHPTYNKDGDRVMRTKMEVPFFFSLSPCKNIPSMKLRYHDISQEVFLDDENFSNRFTNYSKGFIDEKIQPCFKTSSSLTYFSQQSGCDRINSDERFMLMWEEFSQRYKALESKPNPKYGRIRYEKPTSCLHLIFGGPVFLIFFLIKNKKTGEYVDEFLEARINLTDGKNEYIVKGDASDYRTIFPAKANLCTSGKTPFFIYPFTEDATTAHVQPSGSYDFYNEGNPTLEITWFPHQLEDLVDFEISVHRFNYNHFAWRGGMGGKVYV